MSADRLGEEGYILHARPWRDTSLLLEVLLREGGRRGVIARGGRSSIRLRSRLQPFRRLWFDLGGRGELAQLRTVEEVACLPPLAGRALACGYYLNELLMRLLPRDDAHPELFDRYAEALAALAGGKPEAPVLRLFERHLLEELGWAPAWDCCEDGRPVEADGMYHVHPEFGVRQAFGHAMQAVRGASLLRLGEGRFDDPASTREMRLVLHGLLAPHLGPQPLRSRELLAAALGPGREPTPSTG